MAEYQAIDAAASQVAKQRAERPCVSVTQCDRATVFVDGKPVGEGFLMLLAQNLHIRTLGAQATAERFRSLTAAEESPFFRDLLVAAAFTGLMRLDAGSALTAEQQRSVEGRVRGAEQSAADGSVKVDLEGAPAPGRSVDPRAYAESLRGSFEVHTLTSALAARSNPRKELREFIEASLKRHSIEFTGKATPDEDDVLAYAAQAPLPAPSPDT